LVASVSHPALRAQLRHVVGGEAEISVYVDGSRLSGSLASTLKIQDTSGATIASIPVSGDVAPAVVLAEDDIAAVKKVGESFQEATIELRCPYGDDVIIEAVEIPPGAPIVWSGERQDLPGGRILIPLQVQNLQEQLLKVRVMVKAKVADEALVLPATIYAVGKRNS
jgi:hypothetical protein